MPAGAAVTGGGAAIAVPGVLAAAGCRSQREQCRPVGSAEVDSL